MCLCIIFRFVLCCLQLTFPKVLFKLINHFLLLLQNFHLLIKPRALKLKILCSSQKTESQLKFNFDSRNTEQAQRQKTSNSVSLTLPTGFHKINPSRMHPVPPVVIQKFYGYPMEYWLFVRQFEAYAFGNIEDYELFPLLYQYCQLHLQSKFSYVSNQLPVIAFQKKHGTFFIKYGHPFEIARCCKQPLKSVYKMPDYN